LLSSFQSSTHHQFHDKVKAKSLKQSLQDFLERINSNSLRKGPHFRMSKIGEFPDLGQNFSRKYALFEKQKIALLTVKSFEAQ